VPSRHTRFLAAVFMFNNSLSVEYLISDIFGKSGMYVMRELLDGQRIDTIIKGIPSGRAKKKTDQIEEAAICNNLETTQVISIESLLRRIHSVDQQNKLIESEIASRITLDRKNWR
jgi:transposase